MKIFFYETQLIKFPLNKNEFFFFFFFFEMVRIFIRFSDCS